MPVDVVAALLISPGASCLNGATALVGAMFPGWYLTGSTKDMCYVVDVDLEVSQAGQVKKTGYGP